MVIRLAAVACLAFVLAGCGRNTAAPKSSTTVDSAAVAHWGAGLRSWGRSMNKAVDVLSVVFSRPSDVRGIQAGAKTVSAKVTGIEATLLGCTARVKGLGVAPAALLPARAQALAACEQLEKGAQLVRAGVAEIQGGRGVDLFDRASDPLGAGQDDVRRALLRLAPPTD